MTTGCRQVKWGNFRTSITLTSELEKNAAREMAAQSKG